MSFDARHPQGLRQTRATSLYPAALAVPKVSPAVLAKIGESFAAALTTLHASLSAIGALPPAQQAGLDAALAEIARLEGFGLQLQAFARILVGNASVPPERVDLARAARDAIGEWTEAARLRGASLGPAPGSFELEVNASALAQLLDLGLEYALHVGSQVEIGAGLEGFAAHPVLTIRAQRPPAPTANEEDFDEIHWLLFTELARAIGLAPQRLIDARTVTLALGFPNADEGAPRSETPSAALPHTAAAAGRRVLLIEPQDIARVHASRLLHEAGMRVAATSNIYQARAGLKDDVPDVVVTGISIDDTTFHALLDEARAAQPRLRVVELVDDESAFDFSVPGSDSPARVGRRDMAQTLVRAVSQELDAAWPA
jgi:CheY-like chemotaxis protein